MSEGWLQEAVKESGLPAATVFPRDLAKEIPMALRITVVRLPGLTPRKGNAWLVSKGSHGGLVETDEPKHGFTMAHGGRGVLFLDSEDPPDEQRFTLAHEVAHFVLDHLQPRRRAVRARGKDILPVLDGERKPTVDEQLFSVLKHVTYRNQLNLMERNDEGRARAGHVMESEQRADRLAFELLAPRNELVPLIDRVAKRELEAELVSRFGLPVTEAPTYARWLLADRPTRRHFLMCVPSDKEND